VAPDTLAMLFGDLFDFRVIDRVGLTRFTIKGADAASGTGPEGLDYEFEEPVDFVRIVASNVNVVHTIDDWPASFFLRVGKGQVLFTSVEGRAWVRPPTEREMKRDKDAPEHLRDASPRGDGSAEIGDL